ncbi:MAG TPA: response regulator [Chloroflexota bacterium]|nr:response regulator [Chloroflexota bacterium]
MSEREWILVVEDNPKEAEKICVSLAGTGRSVTVVQDGMAALEAFFEDRPPILVTLELDVPSVSGFRLIELFKRHFPRIPVLLVTRLQFEEAEDAIRVGADDFISKPFLSDVLARRAFALIGERSAQDAPVEAGRYRHRRLPRNDVEWRVPAVAARSA